MSLEFYIGDMLRSIADVVSEVVRATARGAKAVGKVSASVVVSAGHSVARLAKKIKTEYIRAKEERELYHKELEQLLKNIDLGAEKAEKWIERQPQQTYYYDEYDFDTEKYYIEDLVNNVYCLPEKYSEDVSVIYEKFQRSYDMTPSEREDVVMETQKLRVLIEDELRRNYATVKTLMGEDFTEEEMQNVSESMIEAIKKPEFLESLKKLLNYLREADEKDAKCKHKHHTATELIQEILNEEELPATFVDGGNFYEENIGIGEAKEDFKKVNNKNYSKRGR